MRQAQLRRHMAGHRWRTVALRRMVAARQISHAHLAGVMRLGLGNFAGDEGVGSGSNCRFKITLRAATTPRYLFNSCLRTFYVGYRPI